MFRAVTMLFTLVLLFGANAGASVVEATPQPPLPQDLCDLVENLRHEFVTISDRLIHESNGRFLFDSNVEQILRTEDPRILLVLSDYVSDERVVIGAPVSSEDAKEEMRSVTPLVFVYNNNPNQQVLVEDKVALILQFLLQDYIEEFSEPVGERRIYVPRYDRIEVDPVEYRAWLVEHFDDLELRRGPRGYSRFVVSVSGD